MKLVVKILVTKDDGFLSGGRAARLETVSNREEVWYLQRFCDERTICDVSVLFRLLTGDIERVPGCPPAGSDEDSACAQVQVHS